MLVGQGGSWVLDGSSFFMQSLLGSFCQNGDAVLRCIVEKFMDAFGSGSGYNGMGEMFGFGLGNLMIVFGYCFFFVVAEFCSKGQSTKMFFSRDMFFHFVLRAFCWLGEINSTSEKGLSCNV